MFDFGFQDGFLEFAPYPNQTASRDFENLAISFVDRPEESPERLRDFVTLLFSSYEVQSISFIDFISWANLLTRILRLLELR